MIGKRFTIGVVTPVGGGCFFGSIVAGVVRRVGEAGGKVVTLQSLDAGVNGDSIDAIGNPPPIRGTAWSHLDGVVVTVGGASATDVQRLEDTGIPVVLASVAFPGLAVPSVSSDNVGGVRRAIEHLVDHGHRRIGFVGNLDQSDIRARFAAYQDAMLDAGYSTEEAWFFAAPDNVERGGAVAASAICDAGSPVSAVLCATDRNALGAMEQFALRGLDVPGDIAVVGFDGIEAGSFSSPSLSTVNQGTLEIGELAASLLLDRLAGVTVETIAHVTESNFVRRGSCGCSTVRADSESEPDRDQTVSEILAVCSASTPRRIRTEMAERTGAFVDRLINAIRGAGWPSHDEICEFAEMLGSVNPEPEAVKHVSEWLSRLVVDGARRAADPQVLRDAAFAVGDLNGALWREFARRSLERCAAREQSLSEQYEVGAHMFDRESTSDVLGWLTSTRVRAGCLALWKGEPADGRLRLVDFYDRDQNLAAPASTEIDIKSFPPQVLIDAAEHAANEVTFVIPVRSDGNDWGLLAVVAAIDTTTVLGREHHSQSASFLAGALQHRAMLARARASEERYGLAAMATNDGLWDWDVGRGLAYFSDRCNELLGIEEVAGSAPLDRWFQRLHPDDRAEFVSLLSAASAGRLDPFEMEQRVEDDAGGYRRVVCRALPIGGPTSTLQRVVGSLADIEVQKQLEERLLEGAMHDVVTGLPNRKLFLERLTGSIARAHASTAHSYSVVFLDLDGFKLINDSLGHLAGDDLLIEIGDRLRRIARATDTPARFGGDEFAVLLADVELDEVTAIVERMRLAIAQPIVLDGHEVHVTATFGVTQSCSGYLDPEDVLRDADIAMYRAKATQRGSCTIFDVEMHAHAVAQLALRGELRMAFERDEFEVHYQPIWSSNVNDTLHFEALLRWRHPERGLQLPSSFIPAITESGQMVRLGRFVMESVCQQLHRWGEMTDHLVRVSVNVSHAEFWDRQLPQQLRSCLQRYMIRPGQLIVEITEDVIAARSDDVVTVMAAIRRAGIELHVDDFGTGTSSLHALCGYPVQGLKIDRSFVSKVGTDRRMEALVRAIVDMGRALGLEVIAEGVERYDQFLFLRDIGCDRQQGFSLSRVLDAASASDLVKGLGRIDVRVGSESFVDDWPGIGLNTP